MRVRQLTIAKRKGNRETVDTLLLIRGFGVSGDYRSEKDGSVSLLSSEAEQKIRTAGGLCTARFSANIFTEGLDYAMLRAGTRLAIGECVLTITKAGKPCYEACPLRQNGKTCPLPESCAFADVVSGGALCTGDSIEVIKK